MNRLENMLVCTVNIKRGNKITVQHEKVLYETNDVIMITFFLTAKQKKKHWWQEAFYHKFSLLHLYLHLSSMSFELPFIFPSFTSPTEIKARYNLKKI